MPDFATQLPEEVKAAIDVLVAAGFRAFTEAKMEDVRELDTGRRLRTFRNRGRYELVLAARRVEDLKCAPAVDPVDPREDMPYPGKVIHNASPGEELETVRPLEEMNVAELRAEAKKHPEITGEYKMLKGDLLAAIRQARRKTEVFAPGNALPPDAE